MSLLQEFAIPVQGLKIGVQEYQFNIDWRFFEHFDHSKGIQGRFVVDLSFDKQYDHWLLVFAIQGDLDTSCDRCLAPISIEISAEHQLIVKYADESNPNREDEVEYVEREVQNWNAANSVLEFILLSLPVRHIYDCEDDTPQPCDQVMLERISTNEANETSVNTEVWNALKDIDFKK